jgi:hypothetical protein
MSRSFHFLPALALTLLVAACSFADDELFPTLAGEDPRGATPTTAQQAQQASTTPDETSADAATPSVSTRSGDVGSGRVGQLRRDLSRLQTDVTRHGGELRSIRRQLDQAATGIDGLADGMETRLRSTRTPNDPSLLASWNEAQSQLNRAGSMANRLAALSGWVTSDATLASYILQSARAANGDPSVSEADRRQLAVIEREADRASSSVDQLLTELSGEIANRSLYIAAAHRRLAGLAPQISSGQPREASSGRAGAAPTSDRRALVTIRFDRPNTPYEQELYSAVSEALERRPDLSFDIVAVSPPGQFGGGAAQRNVESVVKSLTGMGFPAERFRLSAATLGDARGNEVRIYPR